MPKAKFVGNFRVIWQQLFDIPKGFVLLKYKPVYRKTLGELLKKLDEIQNTKEKALKDSSTKFTEEEFLRDLEVTIEFNYRKRTLDQNRLLWSLYEIESNEQNGGMKGYKEQMVTPEELYENDLFEFGVREGIETKRKYLTMYLNEYRVVEYIEYKDQKYEKNKFLKEMVSDDETIYIRVVRGSSKFNTKEMAEWIDMLFNRLAYHGVSVTNPGEILNYWHKFRQHVNDNKIDESDKIMTQEAYKEKHPVCEACGINVIQFGHLAHIKAIGMGNKRQKEPHKNYSSNWLHLCPDCHIGIQHQQGWAPFLEKYPHLKYKVGKALKREYAVEQELEFEEQTTEDKVKMIKDKFARHVIDKVEACLQIEKVGGNPEEIDPDWIGLY